MKAAVFVAAIIVSVFISNYSNGLKQKKGDKPWTPAEKAEIKRCENNLTTEHNNGRNSKKAFKRVYLIQKIDLPCTSNPRDTIEVTNFRISHAKPKSVKNTAFKRSKTCAAKNKKIKLKRLDDKYGSRVITFPGCFKYYSEITVKDTPKMKKYENRKLMAFVDWNFHTGESNKEGFLSDMTCQEQDSNGCGGYGNKCYYCDFCKGLKDVQKKLKVSKQQLCPSKIGGSYTYSDDDCVWDWGNLDDNCDGIPDVVCDPRYKEFREILQNIGISGWGNIVLTFTIAAQGNNNELQMIKREYKRSKAYGDQRYKNFHLPNWRKKNILSCRTVTFDVCQFPPIMVNAGGVLEPQCDPDAS